VPPSAAPAVLRTPRGPGERPRRRRPAPATRVRAIAAVAAVVALGVSLLQDFGSPAVWALPVLVLAVAASEIAVVHLQFGRQRWTFSLTEGALGAAWVASTGAWTVAAVALGVLAAQVVRHQPRLKLEYNVAQFAVATACGSAAATAAGEGVGGAVVGLLVFFLVNHGLVGVAVALTTSRRLVPLLLSSAPLSAVHTAGNSSIGLLAAYLAATAPLGLLGLLVPLVLLWSSYDQQSRRSAEARLFAELARGQERATGRSSDVSAQVVLTAAARLLGGADVEMVLVAPDGPVRYAGDETGVPDRHRVDPGAFDAPWVVRALGSGGVLTGVEQGRPYVSAVIGDPDRPLAVLAARRPPGSAAFGRREVLLAQVLVGQAESWLQVAELSQRTRQAQAQVVAAEETTRALGDLGAAAAPSLRVLHESAERLARLAAEADASDDAAAGGDDIVDELHMVERAVASLLGALALAAEPDLRAVTLSGPDAVRAPEPPVRAERTSEWTTTGVLR
jgi:hypothetical protein